MPSNPLLAVLLSTFNGERYLEAQLESLLQQTDQQFVVVVRDDGSSDSTPAILQRYGDQHPGKFHRVPDDEVNRGACGSFAVLMEYTLAHKQALGLQSAYMMFCDQDDIWLPEKVASQLQVMREVEASSELPVLVHSDLTVISATGEVIAGSLMDYQGLDAAGLRFSQRLTSNRVTGCTVFINEALARKAVPVCKRAIMHDWWLALVAAAFGRIEFMQQALVNYRQHDANTRGARAHVARQLLQVSFWQRVLSPAANEHLLEIAGQAREFRQRFGRELGLRARLGLRLAGAMGIRIGLLQRLYYRLARCC